MVPDTSGPGALCPTPTGPPPCSAFGRGGTLCWVTSTGPRADIPHPPTILHSAMAEPSGSAQWTLGTRQRRLSQGRTVPHPAQDSKTSQEANPAACPLRRAALSRAGREASKRQPAAQVLGPAISQEASGPVGDPARCRPPAELTPDHWPQCSPCHGTAAHSTRAVTERQAGSCGVAKQRRRLLSDTQGQGWPAQLALPVPVLRQTKPQTRATTKDLGREEAPAETLCSGRETGCRLGEQGKLSKAPRTGEAPGAGEDRLAACSRAWKRREGGVEPACVLPKHDREDKPKAQKAQQKPGARAWRASVSARLLRSRRAWGRGCGAALQG